MDEGVEQGSAQGRQVRWLLVVVVFVVLVLCGCAAAVFLVLTGIIAEPETLIEQILRTVTGS